MKARPTMYKGIAMRSRLEAHFAQWLDRMQIPWQYEPMAYADERGQYLPDFFIGAPPSDDDELIPIYVEVKPARTDLDVAGTLAWMSVIWSTMPDATLMLATPHDAGYWKFPLGRGGRWSWAYWKSTSGTGDDTERVCLIDSDVQYSGWEQPVPAVSNGGDYELVTSPWTTLGRPRPDSPLPPG